MNDQDADSVAESNGCFEGEFITDSTGASELSQTTEDRGLTGREIWNLVFALLSWACTITVSTIIVGASPVILLSIGGESNLTSMPLAAFVFGSAFVSLLVTPWLFVKLGRKKGFWVGVLFGLIGTVLGCACIALESVALLTVSMVFFGMAIGVGFFVRFAAIELVPPHWRAKAVALVVSGGVLAAFAGPESAHGMKDAVKDSDLEYMGTFAIAGAYNVANAIFNGLISFPLPAPSAAAPTSNEKRSSSDASTREEQIPTLRLLLQSRQFIIPMLVASISLAVMALPMSIVRVVMEDVGFSSRQSLVTIEVHFAGMYSPGFITGPLISLYGPKRNATAGILVFVIALALNLTAKGKDSDDSSSNMTLWVLGLFFIGVAWNFCFTASTVWITALYQTAPTRQSQVQAANDFLMFLLSGAWILSASYIFEAGGSGLKGWDALNWVSAGLLGFMGVIIGIDSILAWFERKSSQDQ